MDPGKINIVWDGRRIAEFSNFAMGSPRTYFGPTLDVIEFDIAFANNPPFNKVGIFFSILTPRGTEIGPVTGRTVNITAPRVASFIEHEKLKEAEGGTLRLWLKADYGLDIRPHPELRPLAWPYNLQ